MKKRGDDDFRGGSMAKSWYVLHTFSGHENKIERNIKKMMEDGELGEAVTDIKVPSEKVVDVKDGKRKERMPVSYTHL